VNDVMQVDIPDGFAHLADKLHRFFTFSSVIFGLFD
jgi:hypothetical protein